MESLSGDTEESTEDIPGQKKSKFKSLKTRLFGKTKRAAEDGNSNLSQSASDMTAGKGLEEDLSSEGTMGSRALSHDSIFLADQVLADDEPTRVLSQENVHSKIKTLQMKLQQQKMHLGPPPLVLPMRRPEDPESPPEAESFPHIPLGISRDVITQGAHSKAISQPFSLPLLPKPAPINLVTQAPSHPLPPSVLSDFSVAESPLDFSFPAQFTPHLDNSAARHRMSVKPRNQRAINMRRPSADDAGSHLQTRNNIDHLESIMQEEVSLEKEKKEVLICRAPECLPSKSTEVGQSTPEETLKSSNISLPQQDQVPPESGSSAPPQVLRVKPHRPADVISSERPHSCILSEVKLKGEGGCEKEVMSNDKKNTLNKAGVMYLSSDQLATAVSSVVDVKPSPLHQQVQSEARGIKIPAQGCGSFHFSVTSAKNQGERPRASTFVGVFEQAGARQRMEDKFFSSMREKAVPTDLMPRGGSLVVGALHKSSIIPSDRMDRLKNEEPVASVKNVTTNTGNVEVESSQELGEQAVEAQEVEGDGGKTAFRIKLRSTSQSMKFRSSVSFNKNSNPPESNEQCDKQKIKEISDNTNSTCEKLSTNTSSTPPSSDDLRLTDTASSGLSVPVEHTPQLSSYPLIKPEEPETTSTNPKEVENVLAPPQDPKLATQTTSSEVSWMSLAREKTKSLQQLFTSRFPREFTGIQAAVRIQAQVQISKQTEAPTGTQIQTQIEKIQLSNTPVEAANQPLTDPVKAETEQTRSKAQTIKPSLMAVQQKTSTTYPAGSNLSREPQTQKYINEPQSQPNPIYTPSQAASDLTKSPTTPSPVHLSAQTEASSQLAQGSATQSPAKSYISSSKNQPLWTIQSHHPITSLKSTASGPASSVSTTSSGTAPPPISASEGTEREATLQEKGGASLSGRQAIWAGSVSERAAFLEKRADWTTPHAIKGVELKKTQADAEISAEPLASDKTASLSKDTKPEGKQGVKPAEFSPAKVPDRTCEGKWLRKNVASSSPHTIPSSSQSMSDSSQPSWMELAKRKSMAWSDNSID